MSRKVKAPAIGIDLGTTYSCVAVWFDKHNRIEILPNEQGNSTTPSCVACNETELLVGEGAKNQITRNAANTVFDVKRLIGSRFSDSRLQEDIQSWPFKVIEGSEDKPMIVLEHKGQNKEFSAEEISSMILKNLKEAAEAYLGTMVTEMLVQRKALNFCTLFTLRGNGIDVVVLMESIRAISERFANTAYGFLLGKKRCKSSYAKAMIELQAMWRGNVPRFQVEFKPVKQAYRPVSTKHATNTSGSKKNDVEPTKKVSNSNPFNVLNSVENDMDLGTNRGTSNLQIDFTCERRTSCPFLVMRNENGLKLSLGSSEFNEL
ncbi:putative heat shock protein 70 family protein [Tanacetum coccineum]